MDTDQKKRVYRSENINSRGYRSKKAWVKIRESVGTDRRTYYPGSLFDLPCSPGLGGVQGRSN